MDLKQQAKMEQWLAELKDNEQSLSESLAAVAKTHFIYYDALIKAGFKKDHALFLVAQHGTGWGIK